jgi:uncharacterized SAM-binding protein YcdF (DUF218 family)
MFFLGKIFIQLASPLGLCLLLVPLGTICILLSRKRMGWSLIVFAFGWLLTWSLPAVSIPLRQGLERQFPQHVAADYPVVDAIVVLGGGIQGGRKGWRIGPHLGNGADRAWFGAQLYHAGRAPILIVSGGNGGWSSADEPESEAMEIFEKDLGVPNSAVLIEDQSRNTPENAQYTKQLMVEHHFGKILLVTSAVHMPRALALFRAQGIDAIPAPTDFDAIPPLGLAQRWLPDTETLDRSSKAMKEYLAMGIYRIQELGR